MTSIRERHASQMSAPGRSQPAQRVGEGGLAQPAHKRIVAENRRSIPLRCDGDAAGALHMCLFV